MSGVFTTTGHRSLWHLQLAWLFGAARGVGREEVSDVSRRETAMWHRRTKVAGVLHFRVAAAGTPEWGLLLPPPKLPPSGSSRQITARRLMTTLQIKHITLRTLCESLLTDWRPPPSKLTAPVTSPLRPPPRTRNRHSSRCLRAALEKQKETQHY